MPLSKGQTTEIETRIKAFVDKNLKKINSLRLEDITINPYLIATMDLKTPEEIVNFIVTQRFQRSVVTAFGSLLEKQIAKLFGESAEIKDIDLKFARGGKTYYVQLKSGPEGFTGPALDKTLAKMQRLKKRINGFEPVIAFSFGKRDKLSKVWGPRLLNAEDERRVRVMVGREFWEFVLQDPKGYLMLFQIFKRAGIPSNQTLEGEVLTLEKARQDAVKRILPEFKHKYGESGDIVSKLVEDNL